LILRHDLPLRLVLLALVTSAFVGVPASTAATLPSGFTESVELTGLTQPTAVRFASDGRVFVAEKSGLIKVFDSLLDPTPTVFADLRTNVHNFWDRGLLGLALDPGFPARPYVYVLYTHDAAIGGRAPRWGTAGVSSDPCPTPPGPVADGCVVSGRLSRLQAAGNVMTGAEQVLIEDWCQQYPSHSVGALAFGADGALYVSGGDGASFGFVDYGQKGSPPNPCGDPPAPVGTSLTPPTAEGGSLRSQDLRTSSDPAGLDGTILRIDPNTGNALPNNPLASSPDANARRIVAYGLRNPFRFAIRPGTNEIWLGDVGWGTWEEIDRIANPLAGVVNFGWPCYEGSNRQAGYDSADLTLCENLYAAVNAVVAPYFAWNHGAKVVSGESCPTGGSSAAGAAFYSSGVYPPRYAGAFFFADYSRDCIWAMLAGQNGLPDPASRLTFVAGAANPVDLQIGPGGDLFYADFDGGTVRRVRYLAPTAAARADKTAGPAPLTVAFDGTGSTSPQSGALAYAWDLDGDGAFDDSAAARPTYTYRTPGNYPVTLRVTDAQGASDTDSLVITVANDPPVATLASPTAATTWAVGDVVSFSGSATDPQDGPLPPSSFTWSLTLQHCPSSCHGHPLESFSGVKSGSFTAPDHEYPSHLELALTVRDSGGLTDTVSVRLDPVTTTLTFRSEPAGLQLVLGGTSATTPFSHTVIVGSQNSVSAPSPQTLGGTTYTWASWSDGGARSHEIVAPPGGAAYTARFTAPGATPPPPAPTPPPGVFQPPEDRTITGTNGADVLTGTPGNDVIIALGGNDVIRGGGGNDVVVGGRGNDVLIAGGGRDVLVGGRGRDRLIGGRGDDRLIGGRGDDRVIGGDGNDVLAGRGGRDVLFGNAGQDTLLAREGAPDLLNGGSGRDRARVDVGDRVWLVEVRI
jgi:Ca2+-binding RTX toxin-like protein/glucose/arabinose dehydrogenase